MVINGERHTEVINCKWENLTHFFSHSHTHKFIKQSVNDQSTLLSFIGGCVLVLMKSMYVTDEKDVPLEGLHQEQMTED